MRPSVKVETIVYKHCTQVNRIPLRPPFEIYTSDETPHSSWDLPTGENYWLEKSASHAWSSYVQSRIHDYSSPKIEQNHEDVMLALGRGQSASDLDNTLYIIQTGPVRCSQIENFEISLVARVILWGTSYLLMHEVNRHTYWLIHVLQWYALSILSLRQWLSVRRHSMTRRVYRCGRK